MQCVPEILVLATQVIMHYHNPPNRIGGVEVSVLASSVIHRGFEPRSGQTKDYTIGICCFSAKHAALKSKSKDLLARNQDNVSEWGDMSIRVLSAGLTLRQNKHVLRASRGKGGTTKFRPQGNSFYQPDIRPKNTPKIPKI